MPVSPDILSLFLGIKPAAGNSPVGPIPFGASSPTVDGGSVFADILGMISNPTVTSGDAITTLTDDSAEQNSDQPLQSNITEKLGGQFSPVWMLGRPECEVGQPFTNEVEIGNPAPIDRNFVGITTGQVAPIVVSQQESFDATPGTFIPLFDLSRATMISSGLAQQSLTIAGPTNLESGSFDILSTQVQNGTVDLTLKSQDTGEMIRVSLPLAELIQSSSKVLSGAGTSSNPLSNRRVPVAETSSKSIELSTWFEKLQLSELKVEVSPQSAGMDNPVKLTLSGAANAASAGIEVILPQTEVRAFRIAQLNSRTAKLDGKAGGNSGEPDEFGVLSATPFVRPTIAIPRMMMTSVTTDTTTPFTGAFDTTEQGSATVSNDPQLQSTLSLSDQMKSPAGQTGERLEFGSVRFTLPDKIEQSLNPGGKSVMLKIHPEHLGPARLNLNWSGDGISARVTVDSPVAQSAIERSLDRLHEQLSQAGIKVDHIGVSLSGGQTRGQFAGGQSQWQRPLMPHSMAFNNDYRTAEYVSAIAAAPVGVAQYVGSQGVNIFA
jgi:hypothetical protein